MTERGSKSGIAWGVVYITSQISDLYQRNIDEGMELSNSHFFSCLKLLY